MEMNPNSMPLTVYDPNLDPDPAAAMTNSVATCKALGWRRKVRSIDLVRKSESESESRFSKAV